MLCDNCKERDAIINLTQVEHDSKVTLHLCEQCAQQKGVETGGAVLKSPLGNFLGAVVKGGGAGALVPASGDTLRCPRFRPAGLRSMLCLVRLASARPAPPAARLEPARR